jgi:NRPS condensation-like uncharacterized protein
MLNFNHAACEGVGSLRFLRSIGLAYSGLEDPAGDAKLGVRDLARTTAPATRHQRWDRLVVLKISTRAAERATPADAVAAIARQTQRFARSSSPVGRCCSR